MPCSKFLALTAAVCLNNLLTWIIWYFHQHVFCVVSRCVDMYALHKGAIMSPLTWQGLFTSSTWEAWMVKIWSLKFKNAKPLFRLWSLVWIWVTWHSSRFGFHSENWGYIENPKFNLRLYVPVNLLEMCIVMCWLCWKLLNTYSSLFKVILATLAFDITIKEHSRCNVLVCQCYEAVYWITARM